MATRSGFDGVDSFADSVPLTAGDGEGNVATSLTRDSLAPGEKGAAGGAGENVGGGIVAGGAGGSSAGATAVAMRAVEVLMPSRRFQSGGGDGTFQIFAGDSSSTPTWKSSRGLAGA